MSDFALQDGQTFVFAGDSITDAGRRGPSAPLGAGYARLVVDLVTARYPERKINFINVGIGGNTVEDLRNRWVDDVLVHKPDWVSILIGINDLHRTLRGDPTAVPPDKYEKLYREILDMTIENATRNIILLDPFYISRDAESGSWRSIVLSRLPEYIAVVQRLAQEYGLRHVATHEHFQRQLQFRPADEFCPEPVHPHQTGHVVIALKLLETLGW